MYLRFNFLTFCVLIFLGIAHTTAEDKKPEANSLWSSPKDEIYIDDEALEGSGNREVKDDLESSGSGYGPDDEDTDSEDHDGSGTNTGVIGNVHKSTPSKVPESSIDKEPVVPRKEVTNVHSVNTNNIGSPDLSNGDNDSTDEGPNGNDVYIMNAKHEERATSFFAQPGILAAVIGGAVVGLLCAILVVMFIVYRMRKKDEGSYALEEPKRSPTANSYTKNSNREFYA
uniref:Syndecan n=1 Tax=Cuerna arida TaxID=1464854 RepID=A0A1B6EMX2_9HEMI